MDMKIVKMGLSKMQESEYLEVLRDHAKTNLEKAVLKVLEEEEDIKDKISDVIQYGCSAGTISSMVYYADTIDFYEKHKDDIDNLLSEASNGVGYDVLPKLNGYDKEDPLCLHENNKNLLAWFGFEEVCDKFARILNIE